ncbi:MAG TPA: DUF2199 domain-containing protein, partial [Polyangiales bacterium]|nr:DUF2199 domain-containing protein [Polyangiales bacterium]
FMLSDEESDRVELGNSFAELDGERCFVRCLLTIPVEHYGTWSVGIWHEVSSQDYAHIRKVWDDPELYPALRFFGVVANDVSQDLGLPMTLGATVQLHVVDPDEPPHIEAPQPGELADLLAQGWSQAAFEEYAVARGFL